MENYRDTLFVSLFYCFHGITAIEVSTKNSINLLHEVDKKKSMNFKSIE